MVEIRRSTIIDAPIEDVWGILRDFNGHDRWHPAVSSSFIEGGNPVDAVGAVRRFRLADGSELREQLLSLSDRERCFTYCILEAPLPLMGYVAQVALKPVTDGNRTFWEWRSTFHPPENRRRELTAMVSEQIYATGFEAIRQITARGRAPSPDGRPRDMQPQALRAAKPSVPPPHEIARPRAGVRAGRIVTTLPEDRERPAGRPRRVDSHYVYGRAGLPCRICGTPVLDAQIAARRLFWCPVCQA